MSSPPRFLVFRNGSIGNTLVAVPVLRALRAHHPRARIDVVVDGVSDAVLASCPYVDTRIPYTRARDRWGLGLLSLARGLRARGYDAAILCKRFTRNELAALLSGAPRRVAFRTPGRRSLGVTDPVPYEEDVPIVSLLLRLLEPLGIPAAGDHLEYWWGDPEVRRARDALAAGGLDPESPYLVVHPRAGTQARHRVPPAVWAEALDRVRDETGTAALVVLGPGEEETGEQLVSGCRHRPGFLVGESLGTVAAALAGARLFVGHDSGPAHLARAVGASGIVIYTDAPDLSRHLRKWGAGTHLHPMLRSEADGEGLVSRIRSRLRETANPEVSS